MKILDIPGANLEEIDDKELLSLHRRLHQLAGALFSEPKEQAEDKEEGKLTWEDLVNAHAIIVAEMGARDMNHNVRDRLDKESAKVEKDAVSLDYLKARLAETQDVVIVENFVNIAGSVVQKGEEAGDVDLVIRKNRRDVGLEILTRKVFDPEKKGYLHWVYQESGPHADYIPVFDLVLRPKREFKVHTVKAGLKPVTRYTPSKPALIGYTEFFSADELWEKWASKRDVPLYISPKVDGFRCILQKAGDQVSIYFEDSKEERADKLSDLRDILLKGPDCIIEGELQAAKDGKFLARPQVFSVLSGGLEARPYVFLYDLLYLEPEGDVHERPFSDRYALLKSLGKELGEDFVVLPQVLVESEGEFKRVAKEMASWQPFRGAGLAIEGVVARRSDMPYTFGATDDYAKFKTWCEIKVKVLKVDKTANGYVYECALRDDETKKDVTLGKTFVSKEKLANEGDTLNVMVEELLLYPDGKVAWGKPYPMGPDRSRPAYTVVQAIDIARRGRVLKEISEKAVRQPLSVIGGKTRLASKIIALFPPHKRYVEPYAGGAAVFWRKEPSEEEILNDINQGIMAVYKFLQKASDRELQRFVDRDWVGRETTYRKLADWHPRAVEDLAYRTWYISRFGFRHAHSNANHFLHTENGVQADVNIDRLKTLRERLQGVLLEDRDALEVIKKFDSSDTLFYLDPPYPRGREERMYEDDGDIEHFRQLIEVLKDIKGKFILSCNRASLKIVDIPSKWKVRKVATRYTSDWTTPGEKIRYELLVTNFDIKKAEEEIPGDEGETRGERAEKFWQENWYKLYPKSGRGRFIVHEHWRGLSEDEVKLSREELIKRGHSLHSDLRLESDGVLHGWTVFLGKAEDNATNRLISLPPDDNLQVVPKLVQPKGWLTFEGISEPGEVGATTGKYARFDIVDSGTYEAGVWREHLFEYFLHGKKLKGRLLVEFAPVGDRKVWLIDRPADQTPYAESHNLEDVVRELKEKGQKWLTWRKPGERPRLIDVGAFQIKKSASRKIVPIAKVDSARQIVYGIVLDPYIVDSQGDWVPVLEVEKAAHGYMKSQLVGDQHEKKADAELVESWLVPYPTPEEYRKAIAGEAHKVYQFKFGEGEVHSGAWVVGIHVIDKRLWQEVVSGAKTGLSIGAVGERIRNAKVSMPEFETVEPETVPAFIATH
ncbi:MAG: hypothetical protein HPY71_13565 [Firmicutes bacterium]|nr:hypothetical protein [Bacillota bacterium]